MLVADLEAFAVGLGEGNGVEPEELDSPLFRVIEWLQRDGICVARVVRLNTPSSTNRSSRREDRF